MIILGFDPGVNHFGFGVIKQERNSLSVLGYGEGKVPGKSCFEEKLRFIREECGRIFELYCPDVLALEKIYVAKNVQIALDIGIVSGVIAGLALTKEVSVHFLSPREIKQDITGSGNARKEQVGYMVGKILSLKDTPGEHAGDALAAAFSYLSREKFNKILESV